MPIPGLTPDGWLPPGEHECTIDEIGATFGDPEGTDQSGKRRRIMSELRALLASDLARELVDHLYVDGSFVSRKSAPNDVDIVLGMRAGALDSLLSGALVPQATAILAKLEGKLSERIDGKKLVNGFAAAIGDEKYERMRRWFKSDVRQGGPQVKGILKVVVL